MALYLAIDVGGTKTDYLLADETQVLARVRTGTIKRMRTDSATAAAHLDQALAELCAISGRSMDAVTCTCVGTAGITVPLVADWIREAVSERVAGELILVGDVEIALDAAFHGGPGVLVMAGTGSNVAGRDLAGQLTTAGGWGPALADQGSGHRIGEGALRALFLAIDAGRETLLLAGILHFWSLNSVDELVEYANRIPSPDFSALTVVVARCAELGDEVARAVLEREGEELGYLVRLLLRRSSMPAPQLAFTGSVMEKVAPVRQAVTASVKIEFPQVHALEGVIDPLAGALWRARKGA